MFTSKNLLILIFLTLTISCAQKVENPPYAPTMRDAVVDVGIGKQPSWAPDGKRIVAVDEAKEDILIYSLEGAEQPQILSSRSFHPAWAPDGNRIAFVTKRQADMGTDIWVCDLSSGEQTRLAILDSNEFEPAWEPSGARLAFVRDEGGNKHIWIANVDGSGLRQITEEGQDSDPDWSPDGKQIAFASRGNAPTAIWRISLEDGKQHRVSKPFFRCWDTAWSPDGRYIACLGSVQGAGVWLLPVEGGEPIRLTPKGEHAITPAWSPDGRRIAYAYLDDGVFKLRIRPVPDLTPEGKDKRNAARLYQRGKTFELQGRHQAAIAAYQRIIADYPKTKQAIDAQWSISQIYYQPDRTLPCPVNRLAEITRLSAVTRVIGVADYDDDGEEEALLMQQTGISLYDTEKLTNEWDFHDIEPYDVDYIDIDGDGIRELIAVGGTTGEGYIKVYDGISRQIRWQDTSIEDRARDVVAHDVDGDGLLEIIVAHDNGLIVYEESGREKWAKELKHARSVVPEDIDSDLMVEIALIGGNQSNIYVFDGQTGQQEWQSADKARHLAIGDIDGDGMLELVFGFWNKVQAINGANYRKEWELDNIGSITHVHTLDVDSDGREEIAIGVTTSKQAPPEGQRILLILDGRTKRELYQVPRFNLGFGSGGLDVIQHKGQRHLLAAIITRPPDEGRGILLGFRPDYESAVEAYAQFLKLYPESERAKSAQERLTQLGQILSKIDRTYGYTIIEADIQGDETWRRAQSPYFIAVPVTITGSLTIEPGVEIAALDRDVVLYINGNLMANGEPEAPIYFRGFGEEKPGWRGLHFSAGEAFMVHCQFEGMQTGISCRGKGVYTIKRCFIRNNGGGVEIRGNATAFIEGCTIEGNGTGVDVRHSANATILRNIIKRNTIGVEVIGTPTVALSHNTVTDNDIGVDLIGSKTPIKLEGNTIKNNSRDIYQ